MIFEKYFRRGPPGELSGPSSVIRAGGRVSKGAGARHGGRPVSQGTGSGDDAGSESPLAVRSLRDRGCAGGDMGNGHLEQMGDAGKAKAARHISARRVADAAAPATATPASGANAQPAERDPLSSTLRKAYQSTLDESVPDSIMDLLRQLD